MPDLHLGALIDPATGERTADPAVVETEDLVTHGVVVGMTGSGKTGLGVVLVEEVLAAGIPAILIDPKGDLTNLALMFPQLSADEFRPWVDEGAAARAGQGVDELAAAQATAWREGLAGWGIGPERVAALRAAVDVTVYTPGSTAGVPLDLLGSLAAPADPLHLESLHDEIEGYASSLLGMLGIDADPLTSREHILLTNLIVDAWSRGQSLDLPTLLRLVQQPPLRRLGVLELDAFFPPRDRQQFALRLNGLLASPAFARWTQGEPLDVARLLRTDDGRPRCAVVTTSHLTDEERQSVTALLLGKVVSWMRGQSGTTDLRCLLYLDEVAGYVPPSANPPTKKPILLLMKQARAFGVGVVLATQNPVDVDYKALSNAGTWLVGRLQTERDKQRLLDGLSAADGGVDVAAAAATISRLGKRQFLLRRASGEQQVMTTRWAMSYLRGPLTREQIATLQAGSAAAAPAASPAAAAVGTDGVPAAPADATAVIAPATVVPGGAPPAGGPPQLRDDETPVAPAVAAGVPVAYLDPAAPWGQAIGAGPGRTLQAAVVARVHLRYDDTKASLVHDEEYEAVLAEPPAVPSGAAFVAVDHDERDLRADPPPDAVYRIPRPPLGTASWWRDLDRALRDELVRSRSLEIFVNPQLKLYSRVGETREQFLARCAAEADSRADAATAALRDRYEARLRTKRQQLTAAGQRAQTLQAQHDQQFQADVASAVGGLLGGLFGGRRTRTDVARLARRRSGSATKVEAARDRARVLDDALTELEEDLAAEVAELDAAWLAKASAVESLRVPPEATDVRVTDLRLVWYPTPD
jgi:hypothetical protein